MKERTYIAHPTNKKYHTKNNDDFKIVNRHTEEMLKALTKPETSLSSVNKYSEVPFVENYMIIVVADSPSYSTFSM